MSPWSQPDMARTSYGYGFITEKIWKIYEKATINNTLVMATKISEDYIYIFWFIEYRYFLYFYDLYKSNISRNNDIDFGMRIATYRFLENIFCGAPTYFYSFYLRNEKNCKAIGMGALMRGYSWSLLDMNIMAYSYNESQNMRILDWNGLFCL